MKGIVFDIQRFSVHDGPGIRTTVFMKGCPLHCEWCHNPEGLKKEPQILYKKVKCLDCGLCRRACEHEECQPFGRCLHVCPKDCLSLCGKEYSAEELAGKIMGYKPIFDACGGGVTFSGGEPLMQWEFLSQVIDKLQGVHIAVETSGFAREEIFLDMLAKVDFVYMDIKIFDGKLHKQYTGVDNTRIKENFKLLQSSGKPYAIRTPLIKGKTDEVENLRAIQAFIGDSRWEKLPENELAVLKRKNLI